MSETQDLGPYGPILVALLVIAILVIQQPLTGDLVGIPMNWVAVGVVAAGGILGTGGAISGT